MHGRDCWHTFPVATEAIPVVPVPVPVAGFVRNTVVVPVATKVQRAGRNGGYARWTADAATVCLYLSLIHI